LAGVAIEPVLGGGMLTVDKAFLQKLRDVTQKAGVLLHFDEVITGFRVALGGAQSIFNIQPDLTCLGKIIGGGLPVGAYGGSKKIMDHISPTGSVYQAGTLSGNPLAMTAGIKMLDLLSEDNVYPELERKSDLLCNGFKENVAKLGITAQFTRVGSMFSMFFTGTEVVDFHSVKTCDTEFFKRYFNAMLEEGIYIAPSQFEAGFMTTAHTEQDIEKTIQANFKALQKAKG